MIMTVALALMAGMLPTSKVQAQDVITPATQVDPAAAAKAEKEARKAQKAQEKAEKKAKKAEKEAKKRKKAREKAEDAKKDAEKATRRLQRRLLAKALPRLRPRLQRLRPRLRKLRPRQRNWPKRLSKKKSPSNRGRGFFYKLSTVNCQLYCRRAAISSLFSVLVPMVIRRQF